MIKMQIKMNETRICDKTEYTLARIYDTLDRIFTDIFGEAGYSCEEGEREYIGKSGAHDFGKFGRIYGGLAKESWFMDNVEKWVLLDSSDSDNENEFEEEDILEYERQHGRLGA